MNKKISFFLVLICFLPKFDNKIFADANISFVESGDTKKREAYQLYLQATYFYSKGNIKKALRIYKQLFALQPPLFVYEGYFNLLFNVGQILKIVEIYGKHEIKFDKYFAKNLDFNLIIAQSFLSANQDEKAEKIFVKLAANFPNNEQVAYYFAVSLVKKGQLERCLSYLNNCLENPLFKQRYFLFYFLRSKVYMQMNKFEMAMKDIEKSMELFPRFDRAILLKAMLLEQQGQINEAIKGYKNFLNIVGRDEGAENQIIQLLFSQRRFAEASDYLKKLKDKAPWYYFDASLSEFDAGNYEKALQMVDICIQKFPKFTRAKLLKIDILLAKRDYNKILIFMQDWLANCPCDNFVIHTLFLLYKAGVPVSHISGLLEDVAKSDKCTVGVLSALADFYVVENKIDKGINFYKRIFNLTRDNEIKAKVLYQIAYIYFRKNQLKSMEKVLLQAIKYPLVYPPVYNMLAYLYAKKGQNLNQALELVDKALQDDPNSPFYLDTKGLILSKMGKNKQALDLFEKALTIAPGDMVIVDHMQRVRSNFQMQNR